MTVPVQQVTQAFSGDGSTTSFVVSNWTIQTQSDGVTPAVEVYYVTSAGVVVALALNTDYTVTLATNTVVFGTAPPSGSTIQVLSAVADEQPDQFLNEGFLPNTVELALDYLTWVIQQLGAAMGIVAGPYTFSTLPANPQPGQTAWITDATSNVWGAGPVGGGSTVTKVWFNPVSGWVIG